MATYHWYRGIVPKSEPVMAMQEALEVAIVALESIAVRGASLDSSRARTALERVGGMVHTEGEIAYLTEALRSAIDKPNPSYGFILTKTKALINALDNMKQQPEENTAPT